MKVCALLLLVSGMSYACSCMESPARQKLERADIVFRGTIAELRPTEKGAGVNPGFARDAQKTVVFRVTHVWKGKIGQTFEMPAIEETSACIGFWPSYLKVGEDLLVYAQRFGDSGYMTNICGNHKRAKDAADDFSVLGRGNEPDRQREAKQ